MTRTNDTATGSFSLCTFVVHSPIFAVVLYWKKIFLRVKDHKVTEFYLFYSPVMNRAYSMALGEQQLSHQNEIQYHCENWSVNCQRKKLPVAVSFLRVTLVFSTCLVSFFCCCRVVFRWKQITCTMMFLLILACLSEKRTGTCNDHEASKTPGHVSAILEI